jgi:hypothetical protein
VLSRGLSSDADFSCAAASFFAASSFADFSLFSAAVSGTINFLSSKGMYISLFSLIGLWFVINGVTPTSGRKSCITLNDIDTSST